MFMTRPKHATLSRQQPAAGIFITFSPNRVARIVPAAGPRGKVTVAAYAPRQPH
jgi:hypothetical protein